jgi:hypothetical protein
MKGRIALVIPYFGALPNWFPYFANSVARSPILDVLLFTDAQLGAALPDNIKVNPFSLGEFGLLASHVMSIPVSLKFPFKVCDFKPAFGDIFQEFIRDYEFWAFGDLDLVYGDVEAFLDPLLRDYDVISCRDGWVSGSFCVLRNCKEVNSLYRRSADWQKALLSPSYEMFDEIGGFFFSEVIHGADVLSLRGPVESFTHVVKRAAKDGALKCAFSDLACEQIDWGENIIYDAGKLTRSTDGSAVMYVHYVCMKRRFFEVPNATAIPDKFYIRKTGIYLERPDVGTICSQEVRRVLRGSIHGARRLLKRYIS